MTDQLERCLSAIVRITLPSGTTIGTGVVISAAGHVLTCHHVAARRTVTAGGLPASVVAKDPARDLAVLEVPGLGLEPVPVGPDRMPAIGTAYWTAGFHHQSAALSGPTEARGTTGPAVTVAYQDYRLTAVSLAGDRYAEGLSGAPLIQLDCMSVVGIVGSKFTLAETSTTGFAVPLVTATGSAIDAFLGENRETVPRYGAALNRPGALRLCGQQRARMVDKYVRNRVFLPDRQVERTRERGAVAAALLSDRLVTAVVGASGNGKSSLLAQVSAEAAPDCPAVLVRGIDVAAHHRDLRTLIANALPVPPEDVIAAAGALTVVLDGLNEADLALGATLTSWLRLSAEWLRESGSRLVLSSRPEFWDKVHRQWGGADGAAGEIRVGDFKDDELPEVYSRYGLDPVAVRRLGQLGRHPLFIRIAAEAGTATTISELLAGFVDHVCERVSLRVPGTTVDAVQRMLRAAVHESLKHGHLWLPGTVYDRIVAPAVGAALIEEHMFTPVRDGCAIAFDRIGEYVLSIGGTLTAAADLPAPLQNAQLFLVLEADRDGRHDEVARWIAAPAGVSPPEQRPAQWGHDWITAVVDAVAELPDPSRYIDQIEVLAASITGLDFYSTLHYHASRRLLRAPNIEPSHRLRLSRRLAPGEDWYGWRPKDWERYRRVHSSGSEEFGPAVTALVRDHPELLAELTEWLDDETVVGEHRRSGRSETSVADIGAALLWWYHDLALIEVGRSLAARPGERRADLINRLLEHDGEGLLDVVEEWSRSGAPAHQQRLALDHLGRYGWDERFNGLAESPDPEVRDFALPLRLAARPDDESLISLFRERYPRSTVLRPVHLWRVQAIQPALVFDLALDDLRRRSNTSEATEVLVSLLADGRVAAQVTRELPLIVRRARDDERVATALCLSLRDLVTNGYAEPARRLPPPETVMHVLTAVKTGFRQDLVGAVVASAEHSAGAEWRGHLIEEIARSGDGILHRDAFLGLVEAGDLASMARILETIGAPVATHLLLALLYCDGTFADPVRAHDGLSRYLPNDLDDIDGYVAGLVTRRMTGERAELARTVLRQRKRSFRKSGIEDVARMITRAGASR